MGGIQIDMRYIIYILYTLVPYQRVGGDVFMIYLWKQSMDPLLAVQ